MAAKRDDRESARRAIRGRKKESLNLPRAFTYTYTYTHGKNAGLGTGLMIGP